jgi:hypothetical protein
MPKAIKFFVPQLDELKPLYASHRTDHPNYTSKLGQSQEYQSDPGAAHREGFSTLTVRDETSPQLFRQLLRRSRGIGAKPYEVDVEDQVVPEHGLDAPSEGIFKKITPVKELPVPNTKELSYLERMARLDFNDALERRNEYNEAAPRRAKLLENMTKQENELAEEYEKAEASGDTSRMDSVLREADRLADMQSRYQKKPYSEKAIKTGYRMLREMGYSPAQIHEAVKSYRGWMDDMFEEGPNYNAELDNFIKELEEDDEFISDMRLKENISE